MMISCPDRVNFCEMVTLLPFKKAADSELFKKFPFKNDCFKHSNFVAQLSDHEESAATRAFFDVKLWEILALLIDNAKEWNVSRDILAWLLVGIIYINNENDFSPDLRM